MARPVSRETVAMAASLSKHYGVPVRPVDALNMRLEDLNGLPPMPQPEDAEKKDDTEELIP